MPGEKGLRATSPVHVHVEDDIPVHVHVKQKGKKVTKKVMLKYFSSIYCFFIIELHFIFVSITFTSLFRLALE
jgi:hypothetical protein